MILRMLAVVLLAAGFAAAPAGAAASPPPGEPPAMPQPKVRPPGIPAGFVLASPCVAGMGYHWVNPAHPLGPIYGVYDGKPVFSEVMIDQKAFAAGRSFLDILRPLPGYAIDHVDIEFLPYGHLGYPIAHYDIHAYYVAHAVHEAFCPNGVREYTKPHKS